MTEYELIAGCKQGNRGCYELLYKTYGRKLYGIAMRYCSDRVQAEDILQEAMIKVFQSIQHFKGEGSFEGWLKRVVVHTAINAFNKEKRSEWLYGNEQEALWNEQDKETLDQMSAQQIASLIQNLPDGYRMVFNLYEIEGYSHIEIADMLNISEGTSKSQLYKAKQRLKEALNKMGITYYERA